LQPKTAEAEEEQVDARITMISVAFGPRKANAIRI
jgi:hypothetical protein